MLRVTNMCRRLFRVVVCASVEPPAASPAYWTRVIAGGPAGTHPCGATSRQQCAVLCCVVESSRGRVRHQRGVICSLLPTLSTRSIAFDVWSADSAFIARSLVPFNSSISMQMLTVFLPSPQLCLLKGLHHFRSGRPTDACMSSVPQPTL